MLRSTFRATTNLGHTNDCYYNTCHVGEAEYHFQSCLSMRQTVKLLIRSWCNLAGMCVMTNARTEWLQRYDFDLWPLAPFRLSVANENLRCWRHYCFWLCPSAISEKPVKGISPNFDHGSIWFIDVPIIFWDQKVKGQGLKVTASNDPKNRELLSSKSGHTCTVLGLET